jgi:hypothetical protein
MSSVGFGLSPASGRGISELVLHGKCQFADLTALSLARFADTPPTGASGRLDRAPTSRWCRRDDGRRSLAHRQGAAARTARARDRRGRGAARAWRPRVEAARAGIEVMLVDEHPVDNDMMAMDVPLYFGGRMDPAVRNRAAHARARGRVEPGAGRRGRRGRGRPARHLRVGRVHAGPDVHASSRRHCSAGRRPRSWLVG